MSVRKYPSWVMLVQQAQYILYYIDFIIGKYDFSGYVLDIGCGRRGWLSIIVKSYFNSIIVTSDIEPEKVYSAREIAKSLDFVSEGYIVADATVLPFRDKIFDKIIGNAILHHLLDNIDFAAKDFFRITKNNGYGIFTGEIVASRVIGWLWKKFVLEKIEGEGIATKSRWINTFKNGGFSEVHISREVLYGYITNPIKSAYYWIMRHFPETILIEYFITSCTITFLKS